MALGHDELAASLRNHLRADRVMAWTDIQLGAAGSVRPDVYTINKSYVNPCPMAYEVKVSVADFRSDVTSGKWQSYLKYACGVYFACEAGLIDKKDVPSHCGLILWYQDSGTWRRAKKATLNPVTIPEDALIKLLIDGVEREGPRYRQQSWSGEPRRFDVNKKFGAIVARTVRDREAVEHEIRNAKYQAEYIVKQANERAELIRKEANVSPVRDELCDALGLPRDTDRWRIKAVVEDIRKALAKHPAQEKLEILTAHMRSALDRYGFKPEEREESE